MIAELARPPHAGSAGLSLARLDRRVWLAAAATPAGLALAAAAIYFPIPAGWGHLLDGPTRLGAAALIGLAVTAVQRHSARTPTAAMHHAQVLLCVSGALMMVLINDSLARAFGIAGAASLVRFRTPVDDPRDAAVHVPAAGPGHGQRPRRVRDRRLGDRDGLPVPGGPGEAVHRADAFTAGGTGRRRRHGSRMRTCSGYAHGTACRWRCARCRTATRRAPVTWRRRRRHCRSTRSAGSSWTEARPACAP